MSEFLSPGVFIEEVSNAPQTIEAVGTSTMAITGFTPQGPVDTAKLITSPDAFARMFGLYTNQSLVQLSVNAYFTNGGTRCYVVRVVPSDATTATANITGAITGEQIGATQSGSSPTTVTGTLAHLPVTSGSVTIRWTKAATAITGQNPVFSPAENATLLGPFVATLASVPLTNDVITLHWLESTVTKSATLTGSSTLGGTNAANLSSASIIRSTGVLTITFAGGHPPDANSITVDYTPVGAAASVVDSAGTFTGSGISAATVDYTTGAVAITFTGSTIVPYNGSTVTVDYTGTIWGLTAASPGAWGSNLKVTLAGSANHLTYGPATTTGAGTYDKFDITVFQLNSAGVYEIKETYEEVEFTDATDAMYVTDVVNQGSDLVTLTDFGYLNVPAAFTGAVHTAEVVSAANGTTKTFTYTIGSGNRPVLKTSSVVKFTVGAAPLTATADATGVISGSGIDSTKTNTINYTTGAITLNFTTAPDNATNITVDYITVPTSSLSYVLAGGDDGDLSTITNLTVSNATTLKAAKRGMYALSRIDEMMQLIIPDFAGNTTVQSDMIDYAEDRRDLFCILTTPRGKSADEAVDWQRITFNKKSKYAAMYWPWVKMADPSSSVRQLTVPPVAHIAGIYARTDNTKNVSKAPAGTVDGALRGVLGLEHDPDKGERDTVYPARINPLINTPQTGRCVWGVRTMSATNDAFRYINAVRLFIFVEKSVNNSTQNYVFESIGTNLYTSIKAQLVSFLTNLYLQAYFAGSSPSQAFAVVCDSSNNPPAVADAGQVICDVGIAPNKPGEFIRFRLAQKTIDS